MKFLVGAALGALCGLLAKELELPSMISLWGARGALVVECALVGAVLFVVHGRLRALVVVATLALAAAWATVAFTPLVAWLVPRTLRVDPPQHADAVFVFSSALQRDGDPTPVAQARLVSALELVGDGLAPRLVVSELAPPPHAVPGWSYAALARQYMKRLGGEHEVIAVGPVDNTHDEAVLVAKLAHARGWKRVIGVTSPTHTRRACATLETAGAADHLAVTCEPATETRYDLEALSTSDERLYAVANVMHELLGYPVYRHRGWIASQR